MIHALGEQREDHARRIGKNILQRDEALALFRPALAQADEAAEPAIGGAVGGIGEERQPRFLQVQPRADDEGELRILRRRMSAHHACERVTVRHRDGGEPHVLRLHGDLFGVRGAAQEGEVAGALQLGIGEFAHADSPCTYHLGCSSPGSP